MPDHACSENFAGNLDTINLGWPGCWCYGSITRFSAYCDQGSIPTPCSYLNKVTLVTCEKSVVLLTVPNIAGFLRILRFPPVVTLDLWGKQLRYLLGLPNIDPLPLKTTKAIINNLVQE